MRSPACKPKDRMIHHLKCACAPVDESHTVQERPRIKGGSSSSMTALLPVEINAQQGGLVPRKQTFAAAVGNSAKCISGHAGKNPVSDGPRFMPWLRSDWRPF